jgi:hypothetical protein
LQLNNDSLSYTEAGNAIGFALEQPRHVVAITSSSLLTFKTASDNEMKP